jgi:predicted nucleic acid-binding protein
MKIFFDTTAFLAILNVNDQFHPAARQSWEIIIESDSVLYSSNYVLLETTALLQHRFGIEAVRLFERDILPVVEVNWIDELIHKQAMGALLAANRRALSLVDCTSFEIMRQFGIDKAFTFDPHFREQGFSIVPEGKGP